MKCPKCGGNAELSNWGSIIDIDYADYHVECEKCGYHSMGSTDPQKAKEMFEKGMGMHYTNEEWLRQANSEQLEDLLWEKINGAFNSGYACCHLKQNKDYVGRYKKFVEWLKQPHTFE